MKFSKLLYPKDWNLFPLQEVCSRITSGGTPSRKNEDFYKNGSICWVKTKELENYYIYNTEEKITLDAIKHSSAKILPQNTILLAMYGATVGELGILSKEMSCNQACCALIVDTEKFDYRYVFYLLKLHKKEIQSLATGAAQQNLSAALIKDFTFGFPRLERQKKIADILESLDKKIQLNTQTTQTLEAIAQAIFKSWFVDFDPVHAKAAALSEGKSEHEANLAAMSVICGKDTSELNDTEYKALWQIAEAFPSEFVTNEQFGEVPKEWENTTLSEICSMQNGYAFKSNEWTDSGIPVIKIGSVKPMIVDIESNGFVSEENEHIRSDFLLKQGDIVVGLTGYVGEVGRIPAGDKAMLNQRVAKFVPKKLDRELSYYNFVYCLARQRTFKEYAELNAKGSAQANISTRELLNYPICLASLEVHKFFEIEINELLYKILTNSQESKVLEKTRGLLLPKLLSGEIHL
ncbi:Putative type I restriction enzyme specificity protein MPN_638 [Mannheimia haemolytica]|uniref:restriction endonuclease subunit S n=1 Tax=Mannheimia haemolytica TaxID=75985 RepID=UPI000DA3CADB|nr:restriction endonuclease subunit S [Mannheimia haemolytica]SQE31945.1 Putative type I restriction enzyme specificity protein MPN_638 [Mannheimia haemolytica]